jgi:hypothetical protein
MEALLCASILRIRARTLEDHRSPGATAGVRISVSLISLSAAVEVATGIALIIRPSALAWLLLGTDLSQAGQALGRVAGLALLALGWACWPSKEAAGTSAAPFALLVYNVLITAYLAYLGAVEGLVGKLLWPAVAIHAVISIMLVRNQANA